MIHSSILFKIIILKLVLNYLVYNKELITIIEIFDEEKLYLIAQKS